MNNNLARAETQAELVQLLSQANQKEAAQQLTDQMGPGHYKAKALAQVARLYVEVDLPMAKQLVENAWQAISEAFPDLRKHWFLDDALIVLAGTVARWDVSEAEQIIEQRIDKEINRLKAKGDVIAAIFLTNSHETYSRIVTMIEEGANGGLIGFWQALMVCTTAIGRLVDLQDVIQLHEHIVSIEQDIELLRD